MQTPPFVSRFSRAMLELLFPSRCYGCGAAKGPQNPTGFLCEKCRSVIPLYEWLFCPVCQQKLAANLPCPFHKYKSGLSMLGIATTYEHRLVRDLLWAFKYESAEILAEPFGNILTAYYDHTLKLALGEASYKILPLPLHPRRERWRGFNQSELLAQKLSEKTGLAVAHGLTRLRYQKPQMEIPLRKQRFTNIKDAFGIEKTASFENARLILVDDVVTSGATLEEAAKVLKGAGAKQIVGLVIAKG